MHSFYLYVQVNLPQGKTTIFFSQYKSTINKNIPYAKFYHQKNWIFYDILIFLGIRIWRSVTPEISDVQCGFVKDKGTRNATFILRQLAERSIEHQQDMYLCFLDYSKAFDRVRHEPLLEILQSLDIDGKDLRILLNLYWDQTAAVRIDDELSGWAKIQRGVRQGCIISPDLFSLYSESILRHLDSCTGITVGGRQLSSLRYADDTVLLATSKEDLQKLLEIVINESEKLGLNLNAKKTFSMVISGKEVIPTCDLTIGAASVTQVDNSVTLDHVLHQQDDHGVT